MYLGATTVTTDNSGNAAINAQITTNFPSGYTYVTATATDSAGNTSEFSTPIANVPENCIILPSGAVAWWPANGNAVDVIGGHDGTLMNGAGFSTGEVDQAFSVGSGNYVSVPSDPAINPTNAISVEAWVTVTSTGTYQYFINKFNHLGGYLDDSYTLGLTPAGALRWQVDTLSPGLADNIFDVAPPVNIFDGNFHHVAGTYDGSVMKIYFDGALIGSQAASGQIVSTTTPLFLGGALGNGTPNYFQSGKLDEAAIYSRALSAAEIQSIYSASSAGKCTAATFVWVGGASNSLSDPANWLGGVAPSAGENLVFTNVGSTNIVNDFPPDTTFGSISFNGDGNCIFQGNAISVGGDISVSGNVAVNIQLDITLLGSQSVHCTGGSLVISGAINNSGFDLTLDCSIDVELFGAVSGNGGLIKTGSGTLVIGGVDINTYVGETFINAGTVVIQKSSAFGGLGAGTVVADGATIRVSGGITVYENITINGYGFDGNGCLISVGGLVNYWYGTITLGSASAIASIAVTDNIWFYGVINLGSYNLTCCGEGLLELVGAIGGSGGLTKIGIGTLVISGVNNNTYVGLTTVNQGVLHVNGTLLGSAVTVNAGATFGGTGTAGAITIHGGIVSPGISGAGVLNASSALFDASSKFRVDLNGTNPGIGANRYDQLLLTGNVNLGNANLEVFVGFASVVGDQFTILKTTGTLVGSFAQGSSIFVNGMAFSIAYAGNAVVLTHVKVGSKTVLTSSSPTSDFRQAVSYTATVSSDILGTGTPTGTVTFYDGTSAIGTASLVGGVATFTGNSLSVGSHSITAKYNGDGNIDPSLSQVVQQTVNSSQGTVLAAGQTATIGFWHNKNGQALIKSLNGSANATALGNWLATNFTNLYGSGAGANNLAGKTNTQIADFYMTLFKASGQKLDAQVLATSLAVYVTNSTLSGNVATQYGFNVTLAGTATSTFNVGSNGSAFGVANGTTLSILQILRAASQQASHGVLYNGNVNLRNQANSIFDAINQTGDII